MYEREWSAKVRREALDREWELANRRKEKSDGLVVGQDRLSLIAMADGFNRSLFSF